MSNIDKLKYHKTMFQEMLNLIEEKENYISIKLWIRYNLNLLSETISKMIEE